jgi:hypothetical protein
MRGRFERLRTRGAKPRQDFPFSEQAAATDDRSGPKWAVAFDITTLANTLEMRPISGPDGRAPRRLRRANPSQAATPTRDQPEQRQLSWRAHLSSACLGLFQDFPSPARYLSPSPSHRKDKGQRSKKGRARAPVRGRPWRGWPSSSSPRPRSPSTPPGRTAGSPSAERSARRRSFLYLSLGSLGETEI